MKKLSRKQRKLITENAQRREKRMLKAGTPYSKHKKRVCFHYRGAMQFVSPVILVNRGAMQFVPLVSQGRNGEYICTGCGKVFTEEESERLKELCVYLNTSLVIKEEMVEKLVEGVEPVEYYYAGENEIVLCNKVNDRLYLPRMGTCNLVLRFGR